MRSGPLSEMGIANINSYRSGAVRHCRHRDAKRSFQSLSLAPESRGPILVKWNVGHSTRRQRRRQRTETLSATATTKRPKVGASIQLNFFRSSQLVLLPLERVHFSIMC